MAYAQGMGRSSILIISFLLSISYGILVCAYFNTTKLVLNTIICRLGYDPESEYDLVWDRLSKWTNWTVPMAIFFASLPLAFYTTVN